MSCTWMSPAHGVVYTCHVHGCHLHACAWSGLHMSCTWMSPACMCMEWSTHVMYMDVTCMHVYGVVYTCHVHGCHLHACVWSGLHMSCTWMSPACMCMEWSTHVMFMDVTCMHVYGVVYTCHVHGCHLHACVWSGLHMSCTWMSPACMCMEWSTHVMFMDVTCMHVYGVVY